MRTNIRKTILTTAAICLCSCLLLPQNTVTAEAAAKTYKVTYKLNGGVNNKDNPKKLKKGKSAKLKNPTRNGYTFKGWYKDKKLKKKTTKVYGKSKKTYRTVYAKWAKNKKTVTNPVTPAKPSQPAKPSHPTEYKIQYNLNGGTNHPDNPKTVKYGQSVALKDPTKANAEFLGWFTNAGFTTSNGSYATGYGNGYILYAKWKDKVSTPIYPQETCSHNRTQKVQGQIQVCEFITTCCNHLIGVRDCNTEHHIDDPAIEDKTYRISSGAQCPFCGEYGYGTGNFDVIQIMKTTNTYIGNRCLDCNAVIYRNDYNWINEYQPSNASYVFDRDALRSLILN